MSAFFEHRQELLWLTCLAADLGMALLLFRLFGRQGLYATIVLSILLANLQGPKLTVIFGLQTSMGVIVYSSLFFVTDLLSEKYGRREATRAVLIGFACNVLLLLMISISLLFLPSNKAETSVFAQRVHEAMSLIFDYTPRFVAGSLIAYLLSQSLDVWIFHYLRQKTAGKKLWLRNNLSTMLSQLVDTSIYSLIVWWGLVDLSTALQLGAAKYVFKVFIAMFDTPFIYWARTWRVEQKDWVLSAPPDSKRRQNGTL